MKIFKRYWVVLFVLSTCVKSLFADEGMWLPLLLDEQKIEAMQARGFKLTAEEVFSMNQSSLKDAVVRFAGGCTGGLISGKGLLITNHHCGHRQIQSHSSLQNDYLTDGFWATSQDEELANPGLDVHFLDKIKDVTEEVLTGIKDGSYENERNDAIAKRVKEIVENEVGDNTFKYANIQPFFHGNQYFLFVYEVFKDVRLVGAPPSSIGKFGGDTDNWMWPRHTGDFSLFRVYANQKNEPAEYSEENVPYKPKKHFEISLKGINEGDFTMVYGFPGSTQRYLASHRIDYLLNKEYPQRVKLRDYRLKVMQKAMNENPEIRIKYAIKYAGAANAWKKWQGVIRGLNSLDAVETKQENEKKFIDWAKTNNKEYADIINDFEKIYSDYNMYSFFTAYWHELLYGSEIIRLVSRFHQFFQYYQKDSQMAEEKFLTNLEDHTEAFFKDYHTPIDKEITSFMLASFEKDIEAEFHPEMFQVISKKHKGDFDSFADFLFKKSVFLDKTILLSFLDNPNEKMITTFSDDPVYQLYEDFYKVYEQKVDPFLRPYDFTLDSLYRKYIEGLQKMYPDSIFSPDADGTLRITFGNVGTYSPRDAVNYRFYTTLKGVIEKIDPEIYDYDVPEKLINLYENKDYSQYGINNTMPVCFIASNHTSGGNSGSPVINEEGRLVGVNFDRNWEGTMSDIMYDPSQCRNIALDIRYVLFIIDKFASASYLIDEMSLVE